MEANWELVSETNHGDNAYDIFLQTFSRLYEKSFPKIKVSIKTKTLENPWFTKGLLKSSKRKQRLYEKFLKQKTYENETKYKSYKNLFEKLKKQAKKYYYANKLANAAGDTKKTWNVIKEIIGKTRSKNDSLPKQLLVNENFTSHNDTIANSLNDFFINIGPELAAKIPPCNKTFDSYVKECNVKMMNYDLTTEELRDAFSTLQSNKSPGLDKISVNIVKQVYDSIEPSLFHIFNLSIKNGQFPNQLKIARVTPIFKSGDECNVANYRPISVLPCFSKVLERIMYNRLYKHLVRNNILYKKQFGFQKHRSTEHTVIELVSETTDAFNKNMFTLGVFLDLSKAFDTVNHDILLSKLKLYGIQDNSLKWFTNYLTNRKQCIAYNNKMTQFRSIACGIPQGSILGPLLFLIYVNDLHRSSNLLNFILFADDTNLFYSHNNIQNLFQTVNQELIHIHEWLKANKLSLNVSKTKYTLFCKNSKTDDVPLRLPELKINNSNIKRENTMKFLGVMLDESLTWTNHIQILENKVSKNLGILYKAKPHLTLECLKNLYFSFVHSYLNYCNISWASNNANKLKKLFKIQKHACRIVFGVDRFTPTKHLFYKIGALNIHELNIHQVLLFMYKMKHNLTLDFFLTSLTQYSINTRLDILKTTI